MITVRCQDCYQRIGFAAYLLWLIASHICSSSNRALIKIVRIFFFWNRYSVLLSNTGCPLLDIKRFSFKIECIHLCKGIPLSYYAENCDCLNLACNFSSLICFVGLKTSYFFNIVVWYHFMILKNSKNLYNLILDKNFLLYSMPSVIHLLFHSHILSGFAQLLLSCPTPGRSECLLLYDFIQLVYKLSYGG